MQRSFSLFQGHLDLAHSFWEKLLHPGDWAIDATCGNGRDTLKLVELTDKVIALDIQEEAIQKTKEKIYTSFPEKTSNVHFFCQSHETFPDFCADKPIRLIVYNLGYLPGGNKSLTTQLKTTLRSLETARALIAPGGVISVTCYPGHLEGAKEEQALLELGSSLPPGEWSVSLHGWKNRASSPSLLLFQKKFI